MGNLLTPRVGANIQPQGVINALTLHQLDGELVATAEAVSITVKLGGERPGAQGFERVVTNVAVAYGQRGAYAEEFTQTLCSVVHGHTGFSDGGTLNNEARAFSFLGCRDKVCRKLVWGLEGHRVFFVSRCGVCGFLMFYM